MGLVFPRMNRRKLGRVVALAAGLGAICAGAVPAAGRGAPQNQTRTVIQTKTGEVTLQADSQRESGKVFYAEGHVDIVYGDARLRADRLEYNETTKEASAQGNVQFDRGNQHMEAEQANYNFETDTGSFEKVRGSVKAEHFANPNVLVSPNPLTFSAEKVDRLNESTLVVSHAWVTVCRPDRPVWKFYAPKATIHIEKSIRLENATFRLFYVPIVYLPRSSLPVGHKLRQSGLLVPAATKSTTKGYVLGDSFYWAPADWMDATVGAQYLSKRGSSENGELRMKPWENATLTANYYGVIDRGISGPA